jgi:hypothetical protein
MATKVFFIDETYLKDNSPLSGNIDVKEIYPYAKTVEDMYIQEAIGTSLYNDLITKIQADDDLSGYPNELVLVKKIRDVVLWYTVYEALPFISIKVRNIGVVKQTGENLTSADAKDVDLLQASCKAKGVFYMNRLQGYLCDFGKLFSAYDKGTNDDMDPNLSTPSANCDTAFDKNDQLPDDRYYYVNGRRYRY